MGRARYFSDSKDSSAKIPDVVFFLYMTSPKLFMFLFVSHCLYFDTCLKQTWTPNHHTLDPKPKLFENQIYDFNVIVFGNQLQAQIEHPTKTSMLHILSLHDRKQFQ